jgi:hypothetical protein
MATDIKKNVDANALVIGQITMQWTTLQVAISHLFRRLSGLDHIRADAIFFCIKSDTTQREMTLALARKVLAPLPELLEKLEKTFDRIGRYSGERNAAAHAMWVVKLPEGVVMPHPASSQHRRLKVQDHKKQFDRLLSNLGSVFRELMDLAKEIDKALSQLETSTIAVEIDSATGAGRKIVLSKRVSS